jgi:hypothetical protein
LSTEPSSQRRFPAKGSFKSFLKFASVAFQLQEQVLQGLTSQVANLYANHVFTNQFHSSTVGTCRQLGHGHTIFVLSPDSELAYVAVKRLALLTHQLFALHASVHHGDNQS